MGGALERTAGDGFPHKYEVGNGPCLRPLVYWISEILSIIINVHSVPTVLFTGLRGSDTCKLLSGEKEILVKKDHSENFSRKIWLAMHMIFVPTNPGPSLRPCQLQNTNYFCQEYKTQNRLNYIKYMCVFQIILLFHFN